MPWRSRLIASTRSSRSAVSVVCWVSTSPQLFLGAQVDGAEPLAVAPQLFELGLDRGDVRQRGVRLDARRAPRPPSGSTSSISRISWAMSVSRRLAPSSAPRRGRPPRGPRPALRARRARRGRAAPARSRPRPGGRRRRARAASAASISPISARRFSAKSAGASCQRRALVLGLGAARVQRGDLRDARGRGGRSRPGGRCAIASRRRSASSASRASACASARTSASCRRACLSISARTVGELVAPARRTAASAASAASACVLAGAAPRRGWRPAGSSLRSAPRSARRCAPSRARPRRAARARVGLALRCAPVLAGGGFGRARPRSSSACAASTALRLSSTRGARGDELAVDVGRGGCARRAGAPRRSAHARRRQSRPSATGRLRARPAAGRA